MDSSSDEGKLFIGGIGWDTTEERLRDHFSRYGDVAHAMIMRDRLTSQPRGFGFVVFSDPSVIPSILQQAHVIDGRTVEAKRAMSREQQQSLKSGSTGAGGSSGGLENLKTKKIFVGGLPSTLTEDEFREYFQDYGNVTDVVIMYDPNTGRPRGFGFITFTTEDAVDRILQKTFHELKGKLVEVKQALPKDAVISSGARGSYRGYGSYFSSNGTFSSPVGSNGFIQPTRSTTGGYPPFSCYGGANFGYLGSSNAGYSAYGGYGVSGYGSTNAGYTGPAGVYGSLGSPATNFLKNQWRSQAAGYVNSGYSQTATYGGSVPWRNASRSSTSGYARAGRSPSGASPYVNKAYNYRCYGDMDASQSYAGGNAVHPDSSWKSEA